MVKDFAMREGRPWRDQRHTISLLHQTGGFIFYGGAAETDAISGEGPGYLRDLPWEFKLEALQHPEPDIP
jgi:hypothetical protein